MEKNGICARFWGAACLLALALPALPVWAGDTKLAREGQVMGFPLEITVWAGDATAAARALNSGWAEFQRVEQVFSAVRQGSEINEINQYASRQPVQISAEVMSALQWAQSISEISQGAFDITVASFSWEYGFGQGDYRVPTEARLEQIKNWVGYKNIILVPQDKTVLFKRDGVQIDLDVLAKSYALNTVRRVLKLAGARAARVKAGNDVALLNDQPGGSPWAVDIKDPLDPRRVLTQVRVPGGKVLSSGNYERFFNLAGKRYCPIIDPKTGKPSQYALAAALWLPDNPKVDLPSVALMLMPAEKALALVQTIPGAEALIVDGEKKIWMTPGWKNQLKIAWQPG